MKSTFFLIGASLVAYSTLAALPCLADQSQWVTLDQNEQLVATSDQVQHMSESIDLKKGQEKLQLNLTYYNGTATTPPFKWLRIASPSMNYVTEQQFDGKGTFSTDVTGELTWGGNQLLITGAGPKGATFGWRLTTPQPTISGIAQDQVMPGNTMVITGTNLCPDPSGNSVIINGAAAHCVSASADKLVVTVPEDAKAGANTATVSVAGLEAGAASFSVNAQPYLKSLSASWLPPGAQLTIYGENFGGSANGVTVFIGPLQADVVSVTQTSITVVAPVNFGGMPWGYYQPIKVTVNGVRARNRLTVSISQVG